MGNIRYIFAKDWMIVTHMDQNVLMAFSKHYPGSNSDSQSKTNKS
jgi:hypothetical protein